MTEHYRGSGDAEAGCGLGIVIAAVVCVLFWGLVLALAWRFFVG